MISAVVVRFQCGVEVKLPIPNSHDDCLAEARYAFGIGENSVKDKGYYTDEGDFLSEAEVLKDG